jgi:hypothetical protein
MSFRAEEVKPPHHNKGVKCRFDPFLMNAEAAGKGLEFQVVALAVVAVGRDLAAAEIDLAPVGLQERGVRGETVEDGDDLIRFMTIRTGGDAALPVAFRGRRLVGVGSTVAVPVPGSVPGLIMRVFHIAPSFTSSRSFPAPC